MQLRNTANWKALAAMPRAQLGTLYSVLFPGKSPKTVSQACDDIAIELGSETVESALARLGIQTDSVSKAAQAVAERAEKAVLDLAREVQQQAATVSAVVASTNQVLASVQAVRASQEETRAETAALKNQLADEIAGVLRTVNSSAIRLDQPAIDAAINKAVLDSFASFKSVVESASAQTVVADLAVDAERATARDIFGVSIARHDGSHAEFFKLKSSLASPAIDTAFVWTAPILKTLNVVDSDGGRTTLSNLWAGGEKGTGKTQTAMQFAARTGRPYFRINFQKFTMLEDIAGSVGLTSGSTEFIPGTLLRAWSTPYAVINLDEPSLADPGVLGFLNGLLEPGSRVSYGGKVWVRAPGVIVIASDNTCGSGDMTGRYAGTRSQSAAFVDRFGMIARFDYLPFKHEVHAVMAHTGCAEALAEHVLRAIAIAREKVADGSIIDAPSIRSVIAFILSLSVLPVRQAWDATIAARQPAESAVALEAIYTASIDEKLILSLI